MGRFCEGAVAALSSAAFSAESPDALVLAPYAISADGGRGASRAANQLGLREVASMRVPARVAAACWRALDFPSIEQVTGPVDVVHGTNFVVPPARRAGRVATVHDLTPLTSPELCSKASLAYPGLVRRALRRGAFVHVPSHFVASQVVELLGAAPERVRVIAHGIDHLRPGAPGGSGAPREPGAPHGTSRHRERPYVLALGTVEPRKDLPTLVGAFSLLAESLAELDLLIVGPAGSGEARLRDAVASSGFGERVVRLGFLDEQDRTELLQGAAVLAYPSLDEGFGLPPLEAMSVGVPVVASTGGALPETLGDGAVLVSPGDHRALADALASVLEDAGSTARLVARGRERAASYTWGKTAKGLLELYRAAASDSSGA